jgi:ATP-dependent DNA ligase
LEPLSVEHYHSPKEKQRGAVCGDDGQMFQAVCKLGLEGIVSKKLDAPYRSGPSKVWIKVKNPKSPAATRVIDGTF